MLVLPKHTVTFILALGSRAGPGRTGAWPPGAAPPTGDLGRTRRCPARASGAGTHGCSPQPHGWPRAGTRAQRRGDVEGRPGADGGSPRQSETAGAAQPGPASGGGPGDRGRAGPRPRAGVGGGGGARGQSWEETFAPAPNSSNARGALGSLGPRASLGPALKGAAALACHRALRGVAPGLGFPQ